MTPQSPVRRPVALVAVLLAFLAVAVLAALMDEAHAAPAPCTGKLAAKLTQGPDRGLAINGTYRLTLTPSGAFSGVLADRSGQQIRMTGQARGIAVNWVFALPDGRRLYVTGTSLAPLSACGANGADFWGVVTGPRYGDFGIWISCTATRCKSSGFPTT
jgi:hypothetical protein